MTLLSIPKRVLLIFIKIAWKNVKCESYFRIFNLKFELSAFINFRFLDTYKDEGYKGIKVTYAKFMTLPSIFKGTVHMN